MRILIVTARVPQEGGKGDQQRSLQLARLLESAHDVRLLPVAAGRVRRSLGALGALASGLPLQVGWMVPPRAAREIAAAAADADVAIVVTIRCLRERLPVPTVIDHVDALSVNMRDRARLERRLPLRAAALLEAWLLRRHERRAARWVVAQTVVSPLDAAALPGEPPPTVLPLVLDLEPGDGPEARDIDVIMTGDMRYPPNRDGAEWLAGEIVPALRSGGDPPLRVVIAGRAADTLRETDGVERLSDVPDIAALLRRAKVAVVPLRRGTGTPIKLLEAAAAGAAPVSTAWVAAALDVDVDTADDAPSFARATHRLLADERLRRERVAAARAGLRRHSSDAVGRQLEALLARVRNM